MLRQLLLEAVDLNSALLFISVFLLSVLWLRSTRKPPGVPPGPGLALPLLGHMHLLSKDPRKVFRKWRKTYGDVFSFYKGSQLVVVLNGYEAIRQALVKNGDAFSARPKSFWVQVAYKGKGMSASSGKNCKEQRRITREIFTHLGIVRNEIEDRILEEVDHYLKAIESYGGKSLDIWPLTHVSLSNMTCSIIVGKRFDYEDPVFRSCVTKLEQVLYDSVQMDAYNFVPFKDRIPGDPFHWNTVLKGYELIENTVFRSPVKETRRKIEDQGTDWDYSHYAEGYMLEVKRREEAGILSSITEPNLLKTLTDLWSAGTETVATTLSFLVMHFVLNPHVQDKCYEEVVRILGKERPPTMEDKSKMVYLEATTLETLRFSVNVPLSLPHGTACDVSFMDHFIPKDTMVLPNLESVLHDPKVWGDPHNFRPERFISPEGEIVKPDEFIPFSMGRRLCIGIHLAYMELHLYAASLVQRFQFLPPEDGSLPSIKTRVGIAAVPLHPFKVRAVPRH